MTRSHLLVLLAAGMLLAGCADPLAAECSGSRPPLEECTRGLYFAECGGDGATLACNSGGCLWFDGCVARDFRAVECPESNRCCQSTSTGPWPWSDGFAATPDVRHDLAVLTGAPISRASPGAAVTVDATIEPPEGDVAVACTEGVPPIDVCRIMPAYAPASFVGDAFVIELWGGYPFGQVLQIEIVPNASAELVARAYATYQQDVPDDQPTCMTVGASYAFPIDVVGGTLRVNGIDGSDAAAVHGEGSLELADGGEIMIRF